MNRVFLRALSNQLSKSENKFHASLHSEKLLYGVVYMELNIIVNVKGYAQAIYDVLVR